MCEFTLKLDDRTIELIAQRVCEIMTKEGNRVDSTEMISSQGFQDKYDISKQRQARWRKKGLPYLKPNGRILYAVEDIKAWMKVQGKL